MMNSDDNPVSATRLTLPMSGVVALTILLLGLLGAIASGAWAAARSFSSIEYKLDKLTPVALNDKYWTRSEASRYHRDLEKVLHNANPSISFPPPRDPADTTPDSR